MYKAKVNNSFQMDVDLLEDLKKLDILNLQEENFHVLKDGKSYNVSVVKKDWEAKSLTVSVNGNYYTIELQDNMDILLEKMGITKMQSAKINDVKAPMPGLVLDINVSIGQQVTKGEPLLILEAMKMENVLKSQGEGIIKSIEVVKGDAVEKGSILIKFQ